MEFEGHGDGAMTFRLHITADFDTEEEARRANSDAQEAIGKNNGDLQYEEIEECE